MERAEAGKGINARGPRHDKACCRCFRQDLAGFASSPSTAPDAGSIAAGWVSTSEKEEVEETLVVGAKKCFPIGQSFGRECFEAGGISIE